MKNNFHGRNTRTDEPKHEDRSQKKQITLIIL